MIGRGDVEHINVVRIRIGRDVGISAVTGDGRSLIGVEILHGAVGAGSVVDRVRA